MPAVAVTLLSKPGCHLCDDARTVVTSVVGELRGGASALDISLTERSILDDAELLDRFAEEIPVVLIDGAVHNIWRVDPVRLRTALCAAADGDARG